MFSSGRASNPRGRWTLGILPLWPPLLSVLESKLKMGRTLDGTWGLGGGVDQGGEEEEGEGREEASPHQQRRISGILGILEAWALHSLRPGRDVSSSVPR